MEKEQILQFFDGLAFEPSAHKYVYRGIPIEHSVSSLVGRFYQAFDRKSMARAVANAQGKDPEEILAQWDLIAKEACDKGNRTHSFGEDYFTDRSLMPSTPAEEALCAFWASIPDSLEAVFSELRMVHKKYLFAGTADLVLRNQRTGKYIIADYKTNRDLHKNYKGKRMLTPFEDLLDTPLNHYALQLSFYQMMLEQTGVGVISRKVIWLRDDATYQVITVPDYTAKLTECLETYSHADQGANI